MSTLYMTGSRLNLVDMLRRRAALISRFGAAPATTPAIAVPTPPAGKHFVYVQATGQNFRWRADGISPTALVGLIIYAGGPPVLFSENLSVLRFCPVADGGTLNFRWK